MPKFSLKNRIAEHLAIKARKEGRSNIPQMEIADHIGMTQRAISMQIRNKVSRYESNTIIAWCRFLNIDASEFFTLVEIEEENSEGADEPKQISAPLLATA